MCTGQRGFYICPCRSTHCPKRGIVPHRLITQGHVYRIEIDTIAWDICDWWIVNGPPEQVLNRYLKPSCQYFTWHTLMVPSSLCPECQATCTEKKEVKEENSSSDKKASRKTKGKTPKQWWILFTHDLSVLLNDGAFRVLRSNRASLVTEAMNQGQVLIIYVQAMVYLSSLYLVNIPRQRGRARARSRLWYLSRRRLRRIRMD